jgi:hypothetical protein
MADEKTETTNVATDPTLDPAARRYIDARKQEKRQNAYRIMTGQAPPEYNEDELKAALYEQAVKLEGMSADLLAEQAKNGRVSMQTFGNLWLGWTRMKAAEVTARGQVTDAKAKAALKRWEDAGKDIVEYGPLRPSDLPQEARRTVVEAKGYVTSGPNGPVIKPGNLASFNETIRKSMSYIQAENDPRQIAAYMQFMEEQTGIDLGAYGADASTYTQENIPVPQDLRQWIMAGAEADVEARELVVEKTRVIDEESRYLRSLGVSVPGAEDFIKNYARPMFAEYPAMMDSLIGAGLATKEDAEEPVDPESIDDFLDEPKRKIYAEIAALQDGKDPESVEIYRNITTSAQFNRWRSERGYQDISTTDAFQLFLKEWRTSNRSSGSTAQALYDKKLIQGAIPGATKLQITGAKLREAWRYWKKNGELPKRPGQSAEAPAPGVAAAQVPGGAPSGAVETPGAPPAGSGNSTGGGASGKAAPNEATGQRSGASVPPSQPNEEVSIDPATGRMRMAGGPDGMTWEIDEAGTITTNGKPPTPEQQAELSSYQSPSAPGPNAAPKADAPKPSPAPAAKPAPAPAPDAKPTPEQDAKARQDIGSEAAREEREKNAEDIPENGMNVDPEVANRPGPQMERAELGAADMGAAARRGQGPFPDETAWKGKPPPQGTPLEKPSRRKRGSWEQQEVPEPDTESVPEASGASGQKGLLEQQLANARSPEERAALARKYRTLYGLAGVA